MIPGLGNSVLDKNNEKESIKKVKKFLCIMDSMNDTELDGDGKITEIRIARIAYGSGSSIEEVH
jgi:signal recognition particle subunit SRP54